MLWDLTGISNFLFFFRFMLMYWAMISWPGCNNTLSSAGSMLHQRTLLKLILLLNTMQRQCVLWVSPYLPPRPSMRSLSLGSSGLWSCVTSTALMYGSEGSSWTPRTTAESPTWATYIRVPRMTTTLAVVPDVLGRPVSVFGHSAEKIKERKWI